MAQPPTQDYATPQDYTVLNPVTGSELNLGFSLLAPNFAGAVADGSVGVSGTIFTADTALNTPQVPDATIATGTSKWQSYFWIRIPYSSTAGTVAPIGYFWNNSKTNDATFLKWQSTQVDLTAVNASITALQAAVTAAQTTATAANATANTALTNANGATTTANAANNTANAASAAAAAASTLAGTANTTANTANATANAANATAAAAQAAVAAITGSSAVFGPIAINAIGVGGALINQAHNLGGLPSKVRGVLQCINPAGFAGYALNEEVDLIFFSGYTGAGAFLGSPFGTSDTNSNIAMIQMAASFIGVVHKTTGTSGSNNLIAQADWKAKVYVTL